MYLSELVIKDFRIFGQLHLKLQPGLNVLVGENDAGKTAIIDALRLALWTSSFDYQRITDDDFHVAENQLASSFSIQCVFRDLTRDEEARFLEWLSLEGDKLVLYVTYQAIKPDDAQAASGRIPSTCSSGKTGDGPSIEGPIREFLRLTYLRPLRDAEAELSAGRGSRLSQILISRPESADERKDDYDDTGMIAAPPQRLVGIMRQAEDLIQKNKFIGDERREPNDNYLRDFSIGDDVLQGNIGVGSRAELRAILERLELWLDSGPGRTVRTPRGLGVNNVLFMAAELLLLGTARRTLPLLLIEEPEAHLHPQMQLRLMEFLEEKASARENGVQILVTTHSPNLASNSNPENIIVVCQGRAYPLRPEATRLDPSDYRFLRRFLDVTKANLFFAKGVILVEGDAENLLIPTLAKLIDRPLTRHGVSIVSVGHTGLFRYARIFQRSDDTQIMPVRVACVADRDILPDCVDYLGDTRKRESQYTDEEIREHLRSLMEPEGDPVRVFVSPKWTLEYDLAYCGLAFRLYAAIVIAKKMRTATYSRPKAIWEAQSTYRKWLKEGLSKEQIAAKIVQNIKRHGSGSGVSKTEVAQCLAQLLEDWMSRKKRDPRKMRGRIPPYLVEAIDYVTRKDEGVI